MTIEQPPPRRCACHGKTDAELAAPYALFAFSLPVLAAVGLAVAWWLA